MAKNIFEIPTETLNQKEEKKDKEAEELPIPVKRIFSVEVQNGTKVNGLAGRTSDKLKNSGFKVIEIGNAQTQDYEKTFIYDLSPNFEKKDTIKKLEDILGTKASSIVPQRLKSSGAVNPLTDILIILGLDQVE